MSFKGYVVTKCWLLFDCLIAGSAFGIPNWLRIVFAVPQMMLEEAWDRIDLFCLRHSISEPYTGAELY